MAEWFAGLWRAFGYAMGVRLRRIHYQVVSQKPPVTLPNGLPYENTMECWDFLNMASKAARYLGRVDPAAFVDRRNADAVLYAKRKGYHPEVYAEGRLWQSDFRFPSFPGLPTYEIARYNVDQ